MSITRVVLLTHGCAQRAEVLLGQLLDHRRRLDRDFGVVICDDEPGRTAASPGLPRDLVDPDRCSNFGHQEREELIARAGGGLGEDAALAMRFALLPNSGGAITTGANRNAALLQSAGLCFASIDDDVQLEFAAAPAAQEQSEQESALDPTLHWFFGSRAEALAAFPPRADLDWLGAHEGLLGRATDPTSRAAGRSDDAGFVRITATGMLGDCGMRAPLGRWLLRGASAARVRAPGALWTREQMRVVPAATETASPFFMSMAAGFDARVLLPPFLPIGRNAEGVFAALYRWVRPADRVGHVPLAIVHAPPARRPFDPAGLIERLLSWSISDIILFTLAIAPPAKVVGAAARLERLGQHWQALASLPSNELHHLLRRLRQATLTGWRERLVASDLPVERAVIQALESALQYEKLPPPVDLPAADDPGMLQEWFQEWGALLRLWPRIWEACAPPPQSP